MPPPIASYEEQAIQANRRAERMRMATNEKGSGMQVAQNEMMVPMRASTLNSRTRSPLSRVQPARWLSRAARRAFLTSRYMTRQDSPDQPRESSVIAGKRERSVNIRAACPG